MKNSGNKYFGENTEIIFCSEFTVITCCSNSEKRHLGIYPKILSLFLLFLKCYRNATNAVQQ